MNRTVRVSSEPFSDSRQRQALPSCTARRAYPTESLERESTSAWTCPDETSRADRDGREAHHPGPVAVPSRVRRIGGAGHTERLDVDPSGAYNLTRSDLDAYRIEFETTSAAMRIEDSRPSVAPTRSRRPLCWKPWDGPTWSGTGEPGPSLNSAADLATPESKDSITPQLTCSNGRPVEG